MATAVAATIQLAAKASLRLPKVRPLRLLSRQASPRAQALSRFRTSGLSIRGTDQHCRACSAYQLHGEDLSVETGSDEHLLSELEAPACSNNFVLKVGNVSQQLVAQGFPVVASEYGVHRFHIAGDPAGRICGPSPKTVYHASVG